MNKYPLYVFALVLINLVSLSHSQFSGIEKAQAYTQSSCASKETCSACIQTPNCAWCAQEEFGDRPRCFQPDLKPATSCDEAYVVDPGNEMALLSNNALTRGGGMYEESHQSEHSSSSSGSSSRGSSASGSGGVTQISPQHVSVKLRVNEKHSIDVRYSQAEDYPVDLYYLMDLSKSMEDDKEKLSHLGDLLSETMRNITSNFRLGFGSFVDKVLMPYVSTVPKKLQSPCDQCESPYGYKNHMSLDTNTTRFAHMVKSAHVSGNLDAPEGGFDAIMQAIVCENEIGWREQARRLLVFSTDAGFHYAGDGKLGGVITPNDGQCHMDNRRYTHSELQDYPSISQINLKVKEHKINVIFAVTSQEHEVYHELSKHVEGSTSAILSDDSSNIVDLVRDEYSKISSSVEMKDNAQGSVKISYYSKCLGDERKLTNKCDGLKTGDLVTFDVEILVTSCPADPKEHTQTIKIYPVGVGEALIVDLSMICNCDCESTGPSFQPNSEKCKGQGTLKCGVCECYDGFYGRDCECSAQGSGIDIEKDFMKCFANNQTEVECSGRGSCVCGQCHCFKREHQGEQISGKFCECDNFSCDRHGSLLCSGDDHGECVCGKCQCKSGWGGNACECSTSTDTCKAPTDIGDTVCSGHGDCVCGRCECHTINNTRYHGKYCDRCPTCEGRCSELKNCVECQMYNKGEFKGDNNPDCAKCQFVPIEVEDVEYDEDKNEHFCMFFDEDDCRYRFVYNETIENGISKISVRAQKPQECPAKVFLLGIILGVIAAIVLIGMAMLLLWKLLTTIHDRREFARFEKERMMAKWDTGENPIYKQATSTFKNPTYAGK